VLLKGVGSLSPLMSLFLVKGIITILLGFMDDFDLSHYCWTVHSAVCKTSDTV
jgi:hypothetical protein